MKKFIMIISFLFPLLSFADIPQGSSANIFQEQCAKEKDPVKRQNACHILDQHSNSVNNLPEFHKDTVTV